MRRYAAAFDWRAIVPRYAAIYEELVALAAQGANLYQKEMSW
jgi:hypothetical protein